MQADSMLQRIITQKQHEIADKARTVSLEALIHQLHTTPLPELRSFYGAIHQAIAAKQPAIIAEIKKASPSQGIIRADFDPAAIAQSYQAYGATCLSVLTDVTFFQGSPLYLQQAKASCTLPVLQKDFIIDTYQVYEARLMGADCILLIVCALSLPQMQLLVDTAESLNMAIILEVHTPAELDAVFKITSHASTPPIIGINNRDLATFVTSLEVTLHTFPQIPSDRVVISESGIKTAADITKLRELGIHGFLIGESCMRAPNPGEKLRELFAS